MLQADEAGLKLARNHRWKWTLMLLGWHGVANSGVGLCLPNPWHSETGDHCFPERGKLEKKEPVTMLQANIFGDLPDPLLVPVGSSQAQHRPADYLNLVLDMQTFEFKSNYSSFTNKKMCLWKLQIYLHVGLLAETALSTSKGEQACSVFVKASWHSGGFLHVEAKAWSSAEVDMALSNNTWAVSKDSGEPEKQQTINELNINP